MDCQGDDSVSEATFDGISGWIWGEPPTHANVCKGPVSINLTLDPAKAGMGDAYVGMRNIDAYWADLRRRSVSWRSRRPPLRVFGEAAGN